VAHFLASYPFNGTDTISVKSGDTLKLKFFLECVVTSAFSFFFFFFFCGGLSGTKEKDSTGNQRQGAVINYLEGALIDAGRSMQRLKPNNCVIHLRDKR